MLATGPQPPPYIAGRIPRRNGRVRGLEERASDTTTIRLRSRTAPSLANVAAKSRGPKLNRLPIRHSHESGLHGFLIVITCSFCGLAIVSGCVLLARRLQRTRRALHMSSTPSVSGAVLGSSREDTEIDRFEMSSLPLQQQQTGPLRVRKQIRRRLRPCRSMGH